jgi:hypothetical protein
MHFVKCDRMWIVSRWSLYEHHLATLLLSLSLESTLYGLYINFKWTSNGLGGVGHCFAWHVRVSLVF